MKRVWKVFRTLNPLVISLFGISLCFILIYKFRFSASPVVLPFWDIIGNNVFWGLNQEGPSPGPWWDVGYNLSLSTIASIIFYFLLVHLKDFEAKEKINPWITKAAIGVIGQSYFLYSAISKSSGIKISGSHPTEQEIKNICEKINPYGPSYVENGNIRGTYLTWIEFLNMSKGTSQQCIDRLILLMTYLPASLIDLTFRIKGCIYFVLVTNINAEPIRISNLSIDFIATGMFEYFMLTKELTKYLEKTYPETAPAFKGSLED